MILRTRFTDGTRHNLDLGSEYNTVIKETSADEFNRTAIIHFGDNLDIFEKDLYGFVVTPTVIHPLYKGFENVVLSNCGKVFDNLSFVN